MAGCPTGDMNSTILTTIALMGFAAAFRHAAIPSHWLPFVFVGRTRGWTQKKTLGIVLLAGCGHLATNTVLGFCIAWFGFKLDEKTGSFFPWMLGGLLVAIGLYFCWRQWRHGASCHHHHHAGEDAGPAADQHGHGHAHWDEKMQDTALAAKSDWTAIGGLFAMLTLSPCEAFLPIYLLGVPFGWKGFCLLSAVLAVATVGAMTLFTWLTLRGFDRFKLNRIERYEAGLLGVLFIVFGVMVVVLESLGLA
jgi:ABC-type nickel/cobalt efflux system permease component RcnA